MVIDETADWRCSTWSRQENLDPIGSIGSYAGYLLVELPLPWPRDISEIEEIKPLSSAARERNVRIQALVSATPGDKRHIIYYERPADSARGACAVRREAAATPADLADAGIELMNAPAAASPPTDQPRDVLICTHGRRDRCCGKLGTRLALDALTQASRFENVRIWRTSHTGGHRYAPNVLVFPDATAWAYVDAPILTKIVDHAGPVSEVLPHYRGTSWLDGSAAQALERAILKEVGWELLAMPRWSVPDEQAPEPDGGTATRLAVRMPDGAVHEWRGMVRTRSVAIPNCGQPGPGNWAHYDEFQLTSYERI